MPFKTPPGVRLSASSYYVLLYCAVDMANSFHIPDVFVKGGEVTVYGDRPSWGRERRSLRHTLRASHTHCSPDCDENRETKVVM